MANHEQRRDPVFDSDRGTGSTPPERGWESNSVAGRPPTERPVTAFHQPSETVDEEREGFDEETALEEGGSFDAMEPGANQNDD
jgi:hypothetical protein